MTKTVLLLDDEPLVLSYLVSCLREAGYPSIVRARSGHTARVGMLEQTIHILISDIYLPDIDGRAFAAEFLEKHPTGKVILMTGLSPEDLQVPPGLQGRVQILEKPFSSERLIELLESRPEACAQVPQAPISHPPRLPAPRTPLSAAG